jgi:hypothetical protein
MGKARVIPNTLLARLLAATLLCLLGAPALAGSLRMDDPAAFARTHSLGDLIAAAKTSGRPVHIVFVHGIHATGPGTATKFMTGLCRYAPVDCPKGGAFERTERKTFDLGPRPAGAAVMNTPIWPTPEDWAASQTFVDRYEFGRDGQTLVVVDEVNWWPLLFPLKCRFIVAPDARLSGVDKKDLGLCFDNAPPYHAWITEADYAEALQGPKISGGGALADASVKQQLVNWGLADSVITLGPMRTLVGRTMEQAFAYAAAFHGMALEGQDFVVVSESLGSFAVLDAAANQAGDTPTARAVMGGAADLYFFANQLSLLELARITHLGDDAGQGSGGGGLLQRWARGPRRVRAAGEPALRPRQIIAFSDPSDALTFDVPRLLTQDGSEAAIVVNVYDRNEFDWFGLIADPVKAHTGHSGNDAVLRLMFGVKGR